MFVYDEGSFKELRNKYSNLFYFPFNYLGITTD